MSNTPLVPTRKKYFVTDNYILPITVYQGQCDNLIYTTETVVIMDVNLQGYYQMVNANIAGNNILYLGTKHMLSVSPDTEVEFGELLVKLKTLPSLVGEFAENLFCFLDRNHP